MSTDSDEQRAIYSLAVEMADRVSARRGQANQFYLAIETLILGGPAVFLLANDSKDPDPFRTTILAVVGAVISVAWWLQLRSYRELNNAKFQVINEIETQHLSIHAFMDEWRLLKKDPVPRWRKRYAELGSVEKLVPAVFFLVNVGIAVTVWL